MRFYKNKCTPGGFSLIHTLPAIAVRDTEPTRTKIFTILALNTHDKAKLAAAWIVTIEDLQNSTRQKILAAGITEARFRKLNEELIRKNIYLPK